MSYPMHTWQEPSRARCEELDEFGEQCLLVAGPHVADGCLFPLPNKPFDPDEGA